MAIVTWSLASAQRKHVQIEIRELAPTHYWAKMCVVNFSILDFIQIRFYELFKLLFDIPTPGWDSMCIFILCSPNLFVGLKCTFFLIPYCSLEMVGPECNSVGLKMNSPECIFMGLKMNGPECIFVGLKKNVLEYLVCLMTDLIVPVS